MSVLYMEGFETTADQPDIVKRGLLTAAASTQFGATVTAAPSRTGAAGTAMYLRGPYSTATGLPCSGTAVADFGMLPLGQSIYSLWQSGGFALGVNASFNSLNVLQIAPSNTQQLVYDGSVNYWAITYNGSTFGVAYSPDLKNWTPTTATPGNIAQNAYISVTGSGSSATIVVSNDERSGVNTTPFYSTNLGTTWTAMSDPSTGQRAVSAISSSTAAYLAAGYNGGSKISYYTAVNATPTQLSVALAGTTTYYASYYVTTSGGYFIAAQSYSNYGTAEFYPVGSGATNAIAYCATSADPTVAGNWTILPTLSGPQMNCIVYFNGLFLAVGNTGIWSCPKGGSSWTQVLNNSTSIIWSIAINTAGTVAVAVGQDPTNTTQGAIWTSTNGTTWSKQNRFMLGGVAAAGGNCITCAYWDGSRFIATGCLNNNFIAVSTDGYAWSVVYTPDYAETTGTASLSFLGVYSGTQNPATGVFTPWGVAAGNVSGMGISAAAAASSARVVTATTVTAGALAASTSTFTAGAVAGSLGQQPPSTLSHYYELIFTAVAGSPNLFNVAWAIDNALLPTIGQYQLAAPTDTTGVAQAYLNLPRNGNFTVVDDIYLTNFSGSYHNGRLGVQRIYPVLPNTDQTDQMSTTISGATNSNTVNTALSNSEGYVYSSAATAQDIYGTTTTMPGSGVIVSAVSVEGFLTAQNSAAGTGTVGLQSSGVQKLGSLVATNANPTRASLVQEVDPNTNVPWTIAAVNAVDIVVAKTS